MEVAKCRIVSTAIMPKLLLILLPALSPLKTHLTSPSNELPNSSNSSLSKMQSERKPKSKAIKRKKLKIISMSTGARIAGRLTG